MYTLRVYLVVNKSLVRFPKLVEELNSPVVDLSVGLMHVVALTKDGKLYGWGKNDQNQLGKGTIYFTYLICAAFFLLGFYI